MGLCGSRNKTIPKRSVELTKTIPAINVESADPDDARQSKDFKRTPQNR